MAGLAICAALILCAVPCEASSTAPASPLATGGPDAFGYVYSDTLAAGGPVYQWTDTSGAGFSLVFANTDEGQPSVDLPQDMAFYGQSFSRLYVTTNGYATFNNAGVVSACDPSNRQPANTLAAFCADLAIGSGAVYTASATYNGHPALIVQYSGITHKPSGQPATFQIILDFQDHAVVYQYHTMPATPGATVTAGINGYALNQPDWPVYCQATSGCPPRNRLAARFAVLPRPALAIDITPDDVFPDPGQTITYTLGVANNGAAPANGVVMTNALPIGLLYAGGPPQASAGSASYLSVARTVRWDGNLPAGGTVAIRAIARRI